MWSDKSDPAIAQAPGTQDYRGKYLRKGDALLGVPTPWERLSTRSNSAILKTHLPAGKAILDIGCNKGFLLAELPGHRSVGMDLSFGFRTPGPAYVIGDAETLPFRDGSFDAVVLAEVVEHLPDYRACYLEVRRVLRQEGLFLLSHPNKHNPLQRAIEAVKENRWARRALGRSLYAGKQHIREYSLADSTRELEALGMALLACRTHSLGFTRLLSPFIYGTFRCERLFPLIIQLGHWEAKLTLRLGKLSPVLPDGYTMLFQKRTSSREAGRKPAPSDG